MSFVKGEVRRFNTGFVQSGNGCFSMHCPHWHPSTPVPVIVEREWDGEKWVDLTPAPISVGGTIGQYGDVK